MYTTSVSHGSYSTGDKIRVKTATIKFIATVEAKEGDVKKGRPGWIGIVDEVLNKEYPRSNGTEVGDSKWGYTRQIVEVL